MRVLAATDFGLCDAKTGGAIALGGICLIACASAIAGAWAASDGTRVWIGAGDNGRLTRLVGFDDVDGRADWFIPWGGPPDVRTIVIDPGGTLFAHVNVGNITRSTDGGQT